MSSKLWLMTWGNLGLSSLRAKFLLRSTIEVGILRNDRIFDFGEKNVNRNRIVGLSCLDH